jgi:hypothetical protein
MLTNILTLKIEIYEIWKKKKSGKWTARSSKKKKNLFFSVTSAVCGNRRIEEVNTSDLLQLLPLFLSPKIRNLCPTSAGQQVTDAQELEDNLRLFLPNYKLLHTKKQDSFFFTLGRLRAGYSISD